MGFRSAAIDFKSVFPPHLIISFRLYIELNQPSFSPNLLRKIRTLEDEKRQRDLILKRKQEEVTALRKLVKPVSGTVSSASSKAPHSSLTTSATSLSAVQSSYTSKASTSSGMHRVYDLIEFANCFSTYSEMIRYEIAVFSSALMSFLPFCAIL